MLLKFLQSPAGFVTSIMVAIGVFGVGLTWPIWLILAGEGPREALRDGTPTVTTTMIGMAITVVLGIAAQRLRKQVPIEAAELPIEDPVSAARKHRIVHVVTVLMFFVPFVTIILGMMFNQVVDAR